MGTAWASSRQYPWEHGKYVGGIETVKVNIMLRIYSNQWHVYAGLAILNPSARTQIDQYARSTLEIFKLMLNLDEEGLRTRIYAARDKVFGPAQTRRPLLLSEDILDQFSLGRQTPPSKPSSPVNGAPASPPGPTSEQLHAINGKVNGNRSSRNDTNSHLSLLAMVDCWAQLNIQPFVHLDLAATPLFRMWIGVAEILFRSQSRLDGAIHYAIHNRSHRSDDLEFAIAAGEWSRCVSYGNFGLYQQRFNETADFFESRFEEATKVGTAMIKTIMERSL
jgi:prephenate dehydrogenase (NADP+)